MRVGAWADRHTKAVTALKLVLPFVALAILSSLFIFSKVIDPEAAIPYATVDVDDRLREPKMTEAIFAGVTKDGAAITINVNVAIPDGLGGGSAKQVSGQITTPLGATTEIDSAALVFDNAQNAAALSGGVEIRSGGYVMNTAALDVLLTRVSVTSRGVVNAVGPLGTLQAGQMQITATDDANSRYLLVFKSGVHLIYTPVK